MPRGFTSSISAARLGSNEKTFAVCSTASQPSSARSTAACVRHVTDDVVDAVQPVRLQRRLDAGGRADEQTDLVPCVDQRLHRVGPQESGPAGDQHAHVAES